MASFETLERRDLLAADLTFQFPESGTYELFVEGGQLSIEDDQGTVLLQHASTDIATLVVEGTDGNDTLRIRETTDGLPTFSGDTGFQLGSFIDSGRTNADGNQNVGLRFVADAGDDTLELITSTSHEIGYFSGESNSVDPTQKRGLVNVASVLTLSFDGLTPQVIPGSGGGTLLVDASSDPDTTMLAIRDDPTNVAGDGGMMITGDGGFETLFFNQFDAITVIGGDGPEIITLESFDPATSLTAITIDGDNSEGTDNSPDQIVVLALPQTISATLNGGSGDDVFSIDQSEGFVALGPISIDGGDHNFGDSFQFTGDGVSSVEILPDSNGHLATFTFGNNRLTYDSVEVPLIGGSASATYVTPNEVDDLTIYEVAAGGAPVLTFTGSSDGVPLVAPIFANIPSITFDTGSSDGDLGADVIVYDNLDTPQGIVQVNLRTGDFDDDITAASVAMDTFLNIDAGTGNDLIQLGTLDTGLNHILGSTTSVGGGNDPQPTWSDAVTANGATVNVENPIGDTFRVVDFITNFDSAYTIDSGAIEAVGLSAFGYTEMETLELVTGQANNLIEILNTPSDSTLRIQAAELVDQIDIHSTGASSLVDISTFSGSDPITIATTGADSLVRLDTGGDDDSLQSSATGRSSGIIASLGDGADVAELEQIGDLSAVTIQGGAGADSVTVGAVGDMSSLDIQGDADGDQFALHSQALTANTLLSGGEGDDMVTISTAEGDATPNHFSLDGNAIGETVGEVTFAALHAGIEVVALESGDGDDTVTVTPAANVQFRVNGGLPSDNDTGDGDELVLVDDGLTNIVVTQETDSEPGSITADGFSNIVSFHNIEKVTTGDVVDPPVTEGDRFEPNETTSTATLLGSEPTVILRDVNLHGADDVDVYRLTAHDSGALIIKALFSQTDGNLDLEVRDRSGAMIASSDSMSDNASAIIPVVSQQDYFVHIFARESTDIPYVLEIENFAAPIPSGVSLDPATDTGVSDSDGITASLNPRFVIQADLSQFQDMGIPLLDDEAASHRLTGAAVVVGFTDPRTGESIGGFANPVGDDGIVWEYTAIGGLVDGWYLVSAAVFMIDGQRPTPAGDETQLSPATAIVIDTAFPQISAPTVAAGFDTGMDASDGVTNQNRLQVHGTATPFAAVTVGRVPIDGGTFVEVGTTSADSDGAWTLTTGIIPDGGHHFRANATSVSGVSNSSDLSGSYVIDTVQPNTSRISLLSDTGASSSDHLTNVDRPGVSLTIGDVGGPDAPHDVAYRLYVTMDGSATEELLIDSHAESLEYLPGGVYHRTISSPSGGGFAEGTHTLRLDVEDRAGNLLTSDRLSFTVDTTGPQPWFGLEGVSGDGLAADSDTGVPGDRMTSDTTPSFWGSAEPGTTVSLYACADCGDLIPIGQAVATDGGTWVLSSVIDLTDSSQGFTNSGQRTIYLRGTDAAGNLTEAEEPLEIFIDVDGPRVTAVKDENGRSLFDTKPTDGPSLVSNSLRIEMTDDGFDGQGPSFNLDLLLTAGNYSLVGDAHGSILIESVDLIESASSGGVSTATLRLNLASPLPDDRLTLTAYDRITDAAGNALDGDGRSTEPGSASGLLPSGDGVPGGDFVARVTIDALPEIGTWAGGVVTVDTNGNFRFDSENNDDTNEDIIYKIGYTSDDLFAGNFTGTADGVADRFDKIAAYGDIGLSYDDYQFRWLIDTNNDGVIDPDQGDISILSNTNINGLPVAGRFDANDGNGDEVGLFDGRSWWIDRTHDFQADFRVPTELRGYPIVGDFDGDGFDDLATYNEVFDRFEFDLTNGERRGWDGVMDDSFTFEFSGRRDRPVSADFDGDGIDDVGLWAPDINAQTPNSTSEWYILISGGESILNRVETTQSMGMEMRVVDFTPQPFGDDLFAHFGNDYALPIAGNFDPPVGFQTLSAAPAAPRHNLADPLDVNNDGVVSPLDALLVINSIGNEPQMYADTNGDGEISPVDALQVINALNRPATNLVKVPLSKSFITYDLIDEGESQQELAASDTNLPQPSVIEDVDTAFSSWWRSATAQRRGSRIESPAATDDLLEVLAADRFGQNARV